MINGNIIYNIHCHVWLEGNSLQCEAPKIAKLVYNSDNYGLWYLYSYWGESKPTYNWGAHIEDIARCCKISHVVVMIWFYQRTPGRCPPTQPTKYMGIWPRDALSWACTGKEYQPCGWTLHHPTYIWSIVIGKPIIIPTIFYNVGPPSYKLVYNPQ